ncbi:lipid A export permease/ATP-binding protein MsbA [Thioalbus denitrificans]|uniref:Subfamily B ATP-binding cassette protein MsbA n=1 Tax=Thioalbus denitrificans TaxID=547122 RepID=A0A369BXX8_9GAMM|nr:lipid A export permease/ATP-binding protein MsbA [Thioalbus denitrificans]RCX26181.1 subfamily B ATP-binding cassette protein MsbA [Thioalbus denitrificans]
MDSRTLYLRLLQYVRPYWRSFAASLLATAVLAATEPALAALLKPLLDGSFVDKDPTMIRLMPLLLLGVFALRGVSGFISAVALNWVANKVVMDLRGLMFDRLLNLPTRFYDNHPTGVVLSKVTYNVNQVTDAATKVLVVLVRDSIIILGLLGWMLYLSWQLSLIALVLAPLVALAVKLISGRLRRLNRELQQSMGDMAHNLEEIINGHKVVKLFGGQPPEARRFNRINNWVRRYTMKQVVTSETNVPIVQMLAVIGLVVMIYFAALQSAANAITIGGFVSFFGAMALLLAPLKRLTSINTPLQRGLAAAESVFALVDEEPEADTGSRSLARVQGRVEFRDVSFSYEADGRRALEGITLAIEPGENVALVGMSGSGKSTLVQLLPRFYHPDTGAILIDGVDIRELRLADLRRHIALVSQDVVLFNDSVRGNIAYGAMDGADEAAVIRAAEAAHAMEFIRAMPEGLDTLVGDNGVRLSGGQRQRVAIARAILKDAPILILDEATSALDTQSERYIQQALEVLKQGRTTITIAHRLSTIEKADRIVVLDGGRIAETGTHAELLARGGIYSRLHQLQFTRPEAAADAVEAPDPP